MLQSRLVLVTGKGGTGKSAVAASLAIAAVRRGRRVLALALDGGEGLADHLEAPLPGAAPQRHGDLHLARVEPAAALEEYLRLRGRGDGTTPPRPGARPVGGRIFRLAAVHRLFAALVETVPGIRDTVVIGKAVFESTRPRWDLVVCDCPPTGQVLSLLQAPAVIAGLVPSGAVRDQAAWLRTLLADPGHTALVAVATPEELPAAEADEFRRAVAAAGVAPPPLAAANKLLPDDDPGTAPAGTAAAEAVAFARALTEAQGPPLALLQPQHRLPFLFGVHTAGEVAARLAEHWARA